MLAINSALQIHYEALGCCSASATYIFPRPCPEVFSSCWQKASSCSKESKLSSRFSGCGWRMFSSFSTASSGSGRRGSPLAWRFRFSSLCWGKRAKSSVGLATRYHVHSCACLTSATILCRFMCILSKLMCRDSRYFCCSSRMDATSLDPGGISSYVAIIYYWRWQTGMLWSHHNPWSSAWRKVVRMAPAWVWPEFRISAKLCISHLLTRDRSTSYKYAYILQGQCVLKIINYHALCYPQNNYWYRHLKASKWASNENSSCMEYRMHFNFARFNVCVFRRLAAIRKGCVCKHLDINRYTQYNGRLNDDVTHIKGIDSFYTTTKRHSFASLVVLLPYTLFLLVVEYIFFLSPQTWQCVISE